MIIACDSSCTCFNRMTSPTLQAAAPLPPLLVLLPSASTHCSALGAGFISGVSLFLYTLSLLISSICVLRSLTFGTLAWASPLKSRLLCPVVHSNPSLGCRRDTSNLIRLTRKHMSNRIPDPPISNLLHPQSSPWLMATPSFHSGMTPWNRPSSLILFSFSYQMPKPSGNLVRPASHFC